MTAESLPIEYSITGLSNSAPPRDDVDAFRLQLFGASVCRPWLLTELLMDGRRASDERALYHCAKALKDSPFMPKIYPYTISAGLAAGENTGVEVFQGVFARLGGQS